MKKIIFFFHKNYILILFPCILLMIDYLIQINIINKEFKLKNINEKDFFINIFHYIPKALILIIIKFNYQKYKLKIYILKINKLFMKKKKNYMFHINFLYFSYLLYH